MYLRGNWSSVCPALLCNPRRSQVAPGILYYNYLDNYESKEFNGECLPLVGLSLIRGNTMAGIIPNIVFNCWGRPHHILNFVITEVAMASLRQVRLWTVPLRSFNKLRIRANGDREAEVALFPAPLPGTERESFWTNGDERPK